MIIFTFESEVTVLTTEDEMVDALTEGQKGTIFVEENTFLRYHGRTGWRYRCDRHCKRQNLW